MDSSGAGFVPSSYPDVPLYNIQAVAAATGVPAITLRSWERRYGVPRPKRDPKGYRLYSERDIALTRWLRERVQHGVGISRAVHMLEVVEQGDAQTEAVRTLDLTSLQDRLLAAVRVLDTAGISRVVSEGLMVATVEEVCLQLVQPALYRVGEMWAQGGLTVTAEHVGSNLLRAEVAQLLRISPAPLRPERIMVGCAPGEQHDIGALMLSLFLRRRGFGVIFTGASVEPQDFIDDVLRTSPSAVCLSAGFPATAQSLADLFRALLDSTDALLCFGGRAFIEQPGLREQTPGTWLGEDASSAVRSLEATLSAPRWDTPQDEPKDEPKDEPNDEPKED